MKLFKDNTGREWTVAVNVAAIKRVRSLLDVNLLEVIEGKLLERLVRDPILLVDVIYALCKPDADAAGITDEQFGTAMAGDAIDAATKAILEELVDFSPSQRDRTRATKVMATFWRVIDKVQEKLDAKADPAMLEAKLDAAIEKVMEEMPETGPTTSTD